MSEKTYYYICEKCNYKSNIFINLQKHINTEIHKTGKRKERSDKKSPRQCELCDYSTMNVVTFKQHYLNEHATLEEREKDFKYYCKYCNFGTFSKNIIETHNKTKKHIYNENFHTK